MPIPILMYHQIDAPPVRGTPLRGLVVAPASFAWQMNMLRRLGYKGLSMRDLEPFLNSEKHGKVVGITFDDGFRNNLYNALPILQRHEFTATCYGVSAMLDGTNAWDKALVAQAPLMSKHEWCLWSAAGMDVGSHTRHHANLTKLTPLQANDEIVVAKQELQSNIGCAVDHFCYPYGWFGPEHVDMVRAAGYHTAVTTQRGRVQPNSDVYRLKRVMVARATNPLQFYLKVATRYEDHRA